MTPKERYYRVHENWFKSVYPVTYADGHYTRPTFPKISTSNGLTTYIISFCNWQGGNMKRQNTVGRMIGKVHKVATGGYIDTRRMIQSASGRGGADCKGTILGRPVSLEIKIGRDRPSPHQLKEQARERAAGGVYEFVRSVEEFFEFYDSFLLSLK